MAVLNSGPEPLDWIWTVGDTEPETFIITGETPVDLTGSTIEAMAREDCKDATVAATAVVTETDLVNGQFTIGWPGETFRPLVDAAAGDEWIGTWDLQITKPDGKIRTRLGGRLIVKCDVTRV